MNSIQTTDHHNSIESQNYTPRGSLVMICGSMCSGKTEELIRIMSRQLMVNKSSVQTFKPLLDTRVLKTNSKDPARFITSRNGSFLPCIGVNSVKDMELYIEQNNISTVAMDETHFFDPKQLTAFVKKIVTSGKKVILAGLDLDFRGEPFGAMGDLLAYADNVIKLTAICASCRKDRYCLTQRTINGQPAHYLDPIIQVGENEYEPRCRPCHILRTD